MSMGCGVGFEMLVDRVAVEDIDMFTKAKRVQSIS